MDGEMPTSPNIPTPQKKKGLGALAFLEVGPPATLLPETPCVSRRAGARALRAGLFEIFFVVVTLAIFFGVMNYFNILPISQIWPNQLGFLPHREVSTGTSPHRESKSQMLSKPNAQSTPTPALNYSSNVFQYDTKKAETLLTQYLKDNIKPELLPEKIVVKQGQSIDGTISNIKYEFGSQFTLNKVTFSSNFHYKENTSDPNDFIIFIQPSKTEQKTLTSTLATSLTSSYFVNPYTPITNCNTKGTTSYCEIFKIENDGKRGFGTLIEQDTSIVFTCFIPKESKDYVTQKSCISP